MRFFRRCLPYLLVGIRAIIAVPLTLVMLRSFQQKRIGELWEWTLKPIESADLDRGKFTQLHLAD